MMILWIVLVIIIVMSIQGNQGNRPSSKNFAPLDALNERFVRGEIGEEEYTTKKRILKNS